MNSPVAAGEFFRRLLRPRFMRQMIPRLLATILALCSAPLIAQEGRSTSDVKREAKPFPQHIEEGARAVFARLKVVSVPNSQREFIPFALERRSQPENQAGKWVEPLVAMPGAKVEPNLHERVLRDFRAQLPKRLHAKAVDAYLVLYEDSRFVYLIINDGVGSETRFRAVRPRNLHELELSAFQSE